MAFSEDNCSTTSETIQAPITGEFCPENLLTLTMENRLNLILARHGQAEGMEHLKTLDSAALSRVGEVQAARLAERLASLPLDHIYASDQARSFQTAKAVSVMHPRTSLHSLPDIREISAFNVRGQPQARTRDQRQQLHEQRERVKRFADHIRQAHQPGQLIAIIAHNGLNGMLLAELTGISYRQSMFWVSCHTGVAVANVSLDAPVVELRLMGCTRHLPAQLVTWENIKQPPAVETSSQPA